ncbi:hypothetical protein Pelo_17674 [Pelomyxa schiedti]|nr:hypothetical protein Pelo_17674 [Pelomyxa schiedti]
MPLPSRYYAAPHVTGGIVVYDTQLQQQQHMQYLLHLRHPVQQHKQYLASATPQWQTTASCHSRGASSSSIISSHHSKLVVVTLAPVVISFCGHFVVILAGRYMYTTLTEESFGLAEQNARGDTFGGVVGLMRNRRRSEKINKNVLHLGDRQSCHRCAGQRKVDIPCSQNGRSRRIHVALLRFLRFIYTLNLASPPISVLHSASVFGISGTSNTDARRTDIHLTSTPATLLPLHTPLYLTSVLCATAVLLYPHLCALA